MLLKRQVFLANKSASGNAFKSKSVLKESRVRAPNDYVTNVDKIPELKEIMDISNSEPITFIPPPYDADTPLRETPEMRAAKEALLKLNFGEMLELGIILCCLFSVSVFVSFICLSPVSSFLSFCFSNSELQ
jgi:hypothetical protein